MDFEETRLLYAEHGYKIVKNDYENLGLEGFKVWNKIKPSLSACGNTPKNALQNLLKKLEKSGDE